MARTASRGNAVDISGMELEELRELRRAIDERIAEKEEAQQRSIYDEIHRLATSAGTSVEQLLQRYGGRGSRRAGQGGKKSEGGREARYRNPQNPDETWSGRGRQPKWLSSALKSGKRLEEFAIS